MPYFTIMQGLRGCYMPDSNYTIKADTRRELKAALTWEAYSIRDAGAVGLSKKAIAWLANATWKARKSGAPYPFVAPYRWKAQDSYPYGLFACPATRAEFLEGQEQ